MLLEEHQDHEVLRCSSNGVCVHIPKILTPTQTHVLTFSPELPLDKPVQLSKTLDDAFTSSPVLTSFGSGTAPHPVVIFFRVRQCPDSPHTVHVLERLHGCLEEPYNNVPHDVRATFRAMFSAGRLHSDPEEPRPTVQWVDTFKWTWGEAYFVHGKLHRGRDYPALKLRFKRTCGDAAHDLPEALIWAKHGILHRDKQRPAVQTLTSDVFLEHGAVRCGENRPSLRHVKDSQRGWPFPMDTVEHYMYFTKCMLRVTEYDIAVEPGCPYLTVIHYVAKDPYVFLSPSGEPAHDVTYATEVEGLQALKRLGIEHARQAEVTDTVKSKVQQPQKNKKISAKAKVKPATKRAVAQCKKPPAPGKSAKSAKPAKTAKTAKQPQKETEHPQKRRRIVRKKTDGVGK